MTLSSYTYIEGSNPKPELVYDVHQMIEKWKRLFYKISRSKDRGDEAMSRTLYNALKFYDPEKGNLQGYVVKYAKTVLYDNKSKQEVLMEFLEQVLGDGEEVLETPKDKPTDDVPTKTTKNFADDIADKDEQDKESVYEISQLAISNLEEFVSLAISIQCRDTTNHYSKEFTRESLRLAHKYTNFNKVIVDLYKKYKNDIEWFLDIQTEFEITNKLFEEADYTYKFTKPKRLTIVETTEGLGFKIKKKGNIQYKVYCIDYEEMVDNLFNYIINGETNEFSLYIDQHWLFRSLHSNILINTDFDILYEMIKTELITNILKSTKTKYLYDNNRQLYVLQDRNLDEPMLDKVQFDIKNYNIAFTVTEIDNEVVEYETIQG